MLRAMFVRAVQAANKPQMINAAPSRLIATTACKFSRVDTRTDAEIDNEITSYLNRKDIDGWQLRKTLQTIHFRDAIPTPDIIRAAVKACRHQNDYALAVRFLETVKIKCGPHKDKVWPWLAKEVKPTLDELGVLTPEEMGYGKPELYLKSVYDM